MRVRSVLILAAGLLLAGGAAEAQTKTRLTVYSTLVPEYINDFKQGFEADNPDIELSLWRDSTGVVAAKLIAEKDQPRADAIWGLAVTNMLELAKAGILDPYAPKSLDRIKANFRDPATPPAWVGMEAWAAAICFNTVEAAKKGLKRPTKWADLLDPALKGQVLMPDPASSGTGYFHVSAWMQMWGEDKAWAFMDKLHDNMAMYIKSGTKPCRMAAAGEFPVGISYELAGVAARQGNAPIEILVMEEGGGWDMDAAGIVKGTKNLAAAQRLMDWAASEKANKLYARFATMVAMKGIETDIPFYPKGLEESLIKNDFLWASTNRDRILKEWQRRYETKIEK
jgi:iron(III) transport system substrate-binding protein